MRRDARRKQRDDNFDTKKILYITGAIFVLAIIIFVAAFYLYNKQWENDYQEIGKLNTITTEDYEETSSSFGKTVNEVQDETNNASNTETNTVDKIAVNTSAAEEKKQQEKNETTTNTTNTTNQDSNNTSSKSTTTNTVTNTTNNTLTSNTTSNTTSTTESSESKNKKTLSFKKPVEGEIIKQFANTSLVYSNTLNEWVTHNGIDIKAEKTSIVKASEAGTVKSIKNDPRYGLTVVIEHDSNYSTVYANLLSTEFVVVGEEVEQGQTIGTVGNTATFEIADEAHLHFEIIQNSENLDPELYLK